MKSAGIGSGENNTRALIFNIQRFSLHDGPGIRTTVFFKGCPLRCRWCSNPESQKSHPEVMYDIRYCQKCGSCIAACNQQALSWNNDHELVLEPELCSGCGDCAEACSYHALQMTGRVRILSEVLHEIERDIPYYQASGGGVTASGGEPLLQPDFLIKMLKWCKQQKIHTAIETSGFAAYSILDEASHYLDCIYFDIKHIDPEKHLFLSGKDNHLILENLKKLCVIHDDIIIRYPLIPGCNDGKEALETLARWAQKYMPDPVIELIPYHKYGIMKYQMLWREYGSKELEKPTETEIKRALGWIESMGVKCAALHY